MTLEGADGSGGGASDAWPPSLNSMLADIAGDWGSPFPRIQHVFHTLSRAMEIGDSYTMNHQRRVAELAVAIAQELGLPSKELQGIALGAALHDIGKLHVPGSILNKPGPLNPFELRLVQAHPIAGHKLIEGEEFPWPIAEMVLQHHERMDGSGYPRGLKGEEIILPARILAVADVVEAMASDRPYHPAHGMESALDYVLENRNQLFDDRVVHACRWVCIIKGFRFG